MKIAVTGSIATDHLMHFPGRFAEQLIADQLHKVSLSFLVDDLVVRRGGIAANIAFGMGAARACARSLVGAVGADFADYRRWLERHGVDCDSVHVSEVAHTARFVCTTDDDMCQIASFYAGAMSEARNIELAPVADRARRPRPGADQRERPGGDDPAHAGVPGARLRRSPPTRPSSSPGCPARTCVTLIDGADVPAHQRLREGRCWRARPGSPTTQVLDQVEVRVTTLGKDGVEITGRGIEPIHVPVARGDPRRTTRPASATASGPASSPRCRWGLGLERAAQVGSLLAALVLETVGTQEYEISRDLFVKRLAESYGDEAAAEVVGRTCRRVTGPRRLRRSARGRQEHPGRAGGRGAARRGAAGRHGRPSPCTGYQVTGAGLAGHGYGRVRLCVVAGAGRGAARVGPPRDGRRGEPGEAGARELWVDLADAAGVPLRVVEVVLRRRGRAPPPGRGPARRRPATRPTWEQVRRRGAEYEPLIGPRLVVDTTIAIDPLPAILRYLA